MKVVSFDIGRRNLAWCIVETDAEFCINPKLVSCEVISLKGDNLQQWVQSMYNQLLPQTEFGQGSLDACLIELQPSLNPKAVALSQALHMMFLTDMIEVHFCSPHHKLARLATEVQELKLPKDEYKRRKALSVYHAMRLVDAEGRKLLEAHQKRDDASDAFLQAIAWLKTRPIDL